MQDGWIKVAACTPRVSVANVTENVAATIALAQKAADAGAKLIVFPELGLTGYTCGDLFLQESLFKAAQAGLCTVCEAMKPYAAIVIVGLPLVVGNALYNVAAVCHAGEILGIVPKENIPNFGEFYEMRHFAPGLEVDGVTRVSISSGGKTYAPLFGAKQIFTCREMAGFSFGVEICEDVWVAHTPSTEMAKRGAVLIANLSCSDEIIGKAEYRRTILKAKSGSLYCGYIYADAGFGESTQDMVFAGHNLIVENGTILAESAPFSSGVLTADIDVGRLVAERRRSNTFQAESASVVTYFSMGITETKLTRSIAQTPFVPAGEKAVAARCEEILAMQATGLATRLQAIHGEKVVVGLSGGLDSTLALVVIVHAFSMLSLDPAGIVCVTMPCFGTTDRTYTNACRLAKAYGVTLREIPIQASVRQHFQDIGQDETNHNITYENGQARERTQVLMDVANQIGGIVVGTGDLSELALGWATYNGDHMSMYAVNSGVPKTLVRYLVTYESNHTGTETGEILRDICATPVSPELLPPEENGEIAQKTEDIVGPYTLHDFFLYYVLRFGFSPKKIYRMAVYAFAGVYSQAVILHWLRNFYRRFFGQQFKRSCLPDGPKIGSVTLSPRGDWRMPSDASAKVWLDEIEEISKEILK